jgi:signal transduction histidine kinase
VGKSPAYASIAWAYILAVSGLGLLAVGGLLWTAVEGVPRFPTPMLGLAAALLALATLAGFFPVKLGQAQKINLGTAAVFAGVLTLPPALVVPLAALAVGIYSSGLRRPWFNVLFSVGQHALTVTAAALAYGLWWAPERPPFQSAPAAVAAVGAAVVYLIASTGILSGVIATTQQRPLPDCWGALLRQSAAQYGALMATGALGALAIRWAPWAVVLPALFLPLIQQLNRSLERVVAAKDEVEAVLARQRRFVSDLGHEIGTPLTTLSGNVTMLLQAETDDPAERQEILQDVAAEFQRLNGIFSHLMLLAEADERNQLVRRSVRLDWVLSERLPIWRRQAEQAGLTLVADHLEPAPVIGDGERLGQLFGELVENATRYTAPGGQIRLSCVQDGATVQATVADTGVGIAAADLPHIFDRFYRGHAGGLAARSRATGGSGLGLAIARWVAESHGGRIRVESAPGQGSRFTVELPAGGPAEGMG